MERPIRDLSVAFGVAAMTLAALPAEAQPARTTAARQAVTLQAHASTGTISGNVIDESGAVLPGAMVSALGSTLASTVTDERGQFTLKQLPAGDYLLRAHMLGFAASKGDVIRVGSVTPFQRVQLRRLDVAVATTGSTAAPVQARPIIAAGFALPGSDDPAAEPEPSGDEHPHDEAAWRLRHLKRSILKDASSILVLSDDEGVPSGSLFGRAMGSAASLASSLFTEFPFSGEVNFLTTGALAPGAMLSSTALPRGVAYLALAAPGAGGDWSIRGAMSEGDLSSWIVAGAFASKPGGSHKYDLGLSYSTQEYTGGNPAALAAVTDGSRNVGELYGFDAWTPSPRLTLEYGARYAHYDYLAQRGLLSPRFAVAVEALPNTRLKATIGQRMVAPGAEEFLASSQPGPWLPPERTFAPLGVPDDAATLRPERSRFYELGAERALGDAFIVSVGRFHQSVDDQLVTLFGLGLPGRPRSVGHYYVTGAGGVEADGWVVRGSTAPGARLQGSVQYSRTDARWSGQGNELLRAVAPAAIRPEREELHDLTTALTADIRETATRVFVVWKVNTGYVTPGALPEEGGVGSRFGLQVNQALPMAFAGTRWEVLVGLRNLFRDPADLASVYDELLVLRPPKRLVGGFLVRF